MFVERDGDEDDEDVCENIWYQVFGSRSIQTWKRVVWVFLFLLLLCCSKKQLLASEKKQLPAGKQKDELVPKPRHKTS